MKTAMKSKDSVEKLVSKLKAADDSYYNKGTSPLEDSEYDKIKDRLRKLSPKHAYFKQVGSAPSRDKVKLPIKMGSLDKMAPQNIQDFLDEYENETRFVVTPKMDGLACALLYKNEQFVAAYTRGNGLFGRDITALLKHVKCTQPTLNKGYGPVKNIYTIPGLQVVTGELIMKEKNFSKFRDKGYSNARNYVVGLTNSRMNGSVKKGLNHTNFVAYGYYSHREQSKLDQLSFLNKMGFITVDEPGIVTQAAWKRDRVTPNNLRALIKTCKQVLSYQTDGLVIECNSIENRDSKAFNPEYAKAIKLSQDEQESQIATVDHVEWAISGRDLMKPVIVFKKPLNFGGVSVSNVTAHNAKYVYDNKIGNGAKLKIIRSGDVIPYIVGVVKSTKPDMVKECVNCGSKLRKVGVDMYCTKQCYSKKLGRILKFFSVLEIDGFADGMLKALFENGFTSLVKIFRATPERFSEVLGKNRGPALHKALRKRLKKGLTIENYMYATNVFQTPAFGMGTTRLKQISDELGDRVYKPLSDKSIAKLHQVDGLGYSNIECFTEKQPEFLELFSVLVNYVPVSQPEKTGTLLLNKSFCFTGFRDKIAIRYIEENGGTIDGSVKKTTSVLFASSKTSSKAKRAKELGIPVVTPDRVQKYLSNLAKGV